MRTHDAYGPGDIDSRFPDALECRTSMHGRTALLSIFPIRTRTLTIRRATTSVRRTGSSPRSRTSARKSSSGSAAARLERRAAGGLRPICGGREAHRAPLQPRLGQRLPHGIRYWEVWNEPDLGKLFWGGTPEQYFELYAKIARAVKRRTAGRSLVARRIARQTTRSLRDDFLELRARPARCRSISIRGTGTPRTPTIRSMSYASGATCGHVSKDAVSRRR